MKFLIFLLLATLSSFADEVPKPIPLPRDVRIEAAAPRSKVWKRLTGQQKHLAYHLIEAGKIGRTLLLLQTHRHGLNLKKVLIAAFSSGGRAFTKKILGKEGFQELLIYAARFLDQSGPYAGSNRKLILKTVTPQQMEKVIKKFGSPAPAGDLAEMVRLLTDSQYEVLQYPEGTNGAGLELTGGNLYEKGLKGEEVMAALLDKPFTPNLNCRVSRDKGNLACHSFTVKTPGLIGETLTRISEQIKKALAYAETNFQKQQFELMLKFFQTGTIEDFRQANIAWVKDRSASTVDTMFGWVEVYEDWLARIASWEFYVQILDPEVSKLSTGLAKRAQYFEDKMPFGKFKKTFPPDYSPPALMVYYLLEIGSYRTGGYNLPNFDDIRKSVGAKNVIRLPLPGEDEDPTFTATWKEALKEFSPSALVEPLLANRAKIDRIHTLLHEIIGHGSGTYDEAKYAAGEDPVSVLGKLGSALEEERADLTGLVFVNDPALVELGIYKDAAEALRFRNQMYDYYLVDFLRRTSRTRSFAEAHSRGHWLFVKRALDAGAAQWAGKEGKAFTPLNGVLVVTDYDLFQKVSLELLQQLQEMKANRLELELQKLFDTTAPLDEIDKPWAVGIIERGKNLKINSGYVEQPWLVNEKLEFKILGTPTLEGVSSHWREQYP